MKTPFPAYFLEPERNPALPCVTVRPCIVTGLLPTATPPSAIIRLHSLTAEGWVSKFVPYSTLCSSLERAVEIATEKIKALPALDQKSADIETAGAGSGA